MRRRRTDTAELEALLAEQEQALARPYSAVAEVEATQRLRRSIEAQRRASTRRAPRRLVVGAAAAAVVAAAAVGAFALGSGGPKAGFSTALAATRLVPGAEGTATLTRRPSGWRVHLRATGLPRLVDGAFYEAWLRNGAGVLVPIGTFNDGRDVTLWAGVPPTDFTTLTVTRERADGDEGSSGKKVLVGTVTQTG